MKNPLLDQKNKFGKIKVQSNTARKAGIGEYDHYEPQGSGEISSKNSYAPHPVGETEQGDYQTENDLTVWTIQLLVVNKTSGAVEPLCEFLNVTQRLGICIEVFIISSRSKRPFIFG